MCRGEAHLTLIDLKIAAQLHSRAKAFTFLLIKRFMATGLTIRFTTEN